MARRFSAPYLSEPVSSLATWTRNLAVFAVVAVVVSILILRFGFLEMKPALATFFGGLACAGLSILVGLGAFAAILQNSSRRTSPVPPALLIGTLLLSHPAHLRPEYSQLAPGHRSTTQSHAADGDRKAGGAEDAEGAGEDAAEGGEEVTS